MARMDYGKAARAQVWRQSQHDVWSGHVPQATKRASDKQLIYVQALLAKADRR